MGCEGICGFRYCGSLVKSGLGVFLGSLFFLGPMAIERCRVLGGLVVVLCERFETGRLVHTSCC